MAEYRTFLVTLLDKLAVQIEGRYILRRLELVSSGFLIQPPSQAAETRPSNVLSPYLKRDVSCESLVAQDEEHQEGKKSTRSTRHSSPIRIPSHSNVIEEETEDEPSQTNSLAMEVKVARNVELTQTKPLLSTRIHSMIKSVQTSNLSRVVSPGERQSKRSQTVNPPVRHRRRAGSARARPHKHEKTKPVPYGHYLDIIREAQMLEKMKAGWMKRILQGIGGVSPDYFDDANQMDLEPEDLLETTEDESTLNRLVSNAQSSSSSLENVILERRYASRMNQKLTMRRHSIERIANIHEIPLYSRPSSSRSARSSRASTPRNGALFRNSARH